MKPYMIGILIIILVLGALYLIMPKNQSFKEYEYLLNPHISDKPAQNMLVVESKGDPSLVGGKVIGFLYKAYYKQKAVKKNFKMPTIRARWPYYTDIPKDSWIGYFALPIPDSVSSLIPVKNPDNLKISIQKWEYGPVVEILHVGSYDKETPTIQKLMNYISNEGYKVIGEHEEEYLKGPGVFSKGNPNKYMTIIRFRIQKI